MRLTIQDREIELRIFTFPGGEVQVRIEDDAGPEAPPDVGITAHLRSSNDVMTLLLLTDAVRRRYADPRIHLVCPYLPYARQDRVVYPGEALSIAVFCRLLNAQGYASVEVWDAHSDVSLALLDRVRHRPAAGFVVPHIGATDILVAPDQGAVKRVMACAKAAGVPLVHAEKTRNPDTGAITGTVAHSEHVGDRDFLIVDDICDGGRTFTELAQALRPLTRGRIRLYVTHGIFSAGFDTLHAHIDAILVANPFPETLPDFVTKV